MSKCNFYTPEEVKPLYGEIVPAYQAAFAGEPWYEVSKCAGQLQRCVGGLSSLAIGTACELCGNCPNRPAYEADELVERFEALAASRPTAWYAEQNDDGLTLAAIAWKASPSVIAKEKYADVPEMKDWLNGNLSTPTQRAMRRIGISPKEPQVMWLDEVFANKQIKPEGNLQNFGKFVVGLAEMLDTELVAYRTIEPRMTAVPKRDFGIDATVLQRNEGVPDRRDFVTIDTMELEQVFVPPIETGCTGISYRKVRKQR